MCVVDVCGVVIVVVVVDIVVVYVIVICLQDLVAVAAAALLTQSTYNFPQSSQREIDCPQLGEMLLRDTNLPAMTLLLYKLLRAG